MDVPGLRRHALEEIRRFEEQARASGVPSEVVLSARYVAVRRARRGGAVDAVGQSERMGAASAAGGAASRGVGRREVLRHAGPDLAGSGALHRPDGAAVSRARVRLRRQVPGAGARARAAAARSSRISTARSATIAARPSPTLSLRWRGLEDRRNPLIRLRAVVGGRRRGAADPRRSRSPSTTRAWPRTADPVHARAREGRPRGIFAAARSRCRSRGPTLKQLLAADEQQRRAQRRGAGQPDDGHAAGARPVPVRQRDGQPGVPATRSQRLTAALEQGAGPRAGRRAHRRSADQVAPVPGQLRAVARARRERRRRCCSRASTIRARLTCDRRRRRRNRATVPSRIRRTARATGGWKSSTSAALT